MQETENNKISPQKTGSPELRYRLPRGAVARLADKYGVSWVWAHTVISGKQQGNPDLIIDAEKLALIEDENRKKLAEVI